MKPFSIVVLFLLLGLVGCSSTPPSPRDNASHFQPPTQGSRPKTSDKLTPSEDFHNNTGYYRALFNMNTSDCKSSSGIPGVYIIKLHDQSVVKARGGLVGDRILQISAHRPRTSRELTYIIKRITPDTAVPIVLERSGRIFEILVIPPPWVPTEDQKAFIDSPYQSNPCPSIGMMSMN